MEQWAPASQQPAPLPARGEQPADGNVFARWLSLWGHEAELDRCARWGGGAALCWTGSCIPCSRMFVIKCLPVATHHTPWRPCRLFFPLAVGMWLPYIWHLWPVTTAAEQRQHVALLFILLLNAASAW